ncbi:unnamed protein product [Caenorhabditis auriculariae]|uniref:J domain-containing protein n=1 Tax=Caenorhabditis auriculariae TaxID=2777116 RepID=A0A8S1GQ26_9PELO|nr:unnamed protein product [Caenorhabditis auriculariae]
MLLLWLTTFSLLIWAVESDRAAQEISKGNVNLAKGQYNEALQHYHEAVEADSTNVQALFRRGTTQLFLGRPSLAIRDFDAVLRLKPDMSTARTQRGNVLFKQGKLEEAKLDFKKALESENSNKEAWEGLEKVMIWDSSLYRIRAKCSQQRGDIHSALMDLRKVAKLDTDHADDVLYEMSRLHYESGSVEQALRSIRDCLKYNPDHKLGYPFYKKLRKIGKIRDAMIAKSENEEWNECVKKAGEILKSDVSEAIRIDINRFSCKCNRENGDLEQAIQDCSKVINDNPNDVDILCERAEAHILNDDLDSALNDFTEASNIDSGNSAARKGIERVKSLKENAGKRDYYRILGVSRSANKRTITKAYRKLAQKWHPDLFTDEKEKQKAQKKFIDIAAAKEVLTDDEKRSKFDNGIDPLDTSNQQGGAHHHGFQGFRGFQGFNDGQYQFFFRQ